MPLTADGLPEVSDDFRRWTFKVRPGIFFADDPAFQGRPRELVAADYVYTIKRFYDPAIRTEHLYRFENAKILGLSELRQQVLKSKTPFPYDTEVPGLRALVGGSLGAGSGERSAGLLIAEAPAQGVWDAFARALLEAGEEEAQRRQPEGRGSTRRSG